VLSPDEVIAVIRDTMGFDQQRAVSLVTTPPPYYITLTIVLLHYIALEPLHYRLHYTCVQLPFGVMHNDLVD